MMLDKKQIWAIFLFEFKMGCKAAETNCNIINNNINNNWLWNYKWMYSAVVVQEVCKGNESFENEEHSGWPLEVNNDQLRGSSELIPLQLHEKLLKNSTLTALQLFSIWSKLERWKSSISECLMRWLQILKTVILKCLILCNNNESFLNWILMCNEVYFIQQTMSSSLPKAKLVPRKGHGHCLVVCCWSDLLQLSESWWNHYICEVCSANWWNALKPVMPEASIGQQKEPSYFPWPLPTTGCTTNASKFEQIGLCLIYHIHLTSCQLSTTLSILTTFCRENASTISRRQKMLSKGSANPEACIFTLQEYTDLFLVGKNVLIAMVPIFISKDVFQPSCDLKFMSKTSIIFVPT